MAVVGTALHFDIHAVTRSVLLGFTLAVGACSASSTPMMPSASGPIPVSGGAGTGAASGSTMSGPLMGAAGFDNNTGVVVTTPGMSSAGTSGGTAGATGTTDSSRDPISIDACDAMNAAGLSTADVQKLKAGAAPGMLKMLYPYDGTVFPRGMLAPDVMWSGANADVVYVHIKGQAFEYAGCLKPVAPGQLTLAQDIWDKAGQRTFGQQEVFTLDLTTSSAGVIAGPVTLHFQIAQATLKGSIYYNSYASTLSAGGAAGAAPVGIFGGGGAANGAVLRIPAGGKAELFGQTACNACHTVSADGSRLLTQTVGNGAASYQLTGSAMPMSTMAGSSDAFAALYPDGSAFLQMSTVIDVARTVFFGGNTAGSTNATLVDSNTGKPIMSTGIPMGVLMPNFSPDGLYLAFNDYAIDTAHGIAIMHYDTKTHTASNYAKLYQETAGSMTRPGWPFILPDDHGVVFVRTQDSDFTGGGIGVGQSAGIVAANAPVSELSVIDVGSGTVTLLAKAMGYLKPEDATNNTTYLPFGAEELHHSYYPTVSPVAAGGYFWVFFDSIRHYGGLGMQRQLWGAAIDISSDGTYKIDPSHPPFYVPGQELGTGNHRAFAALDPCHKDGDKCTSGIDCCGGFCYIDAPEELVDPVGSCTPKMTTICAKRDERCTKDSDCCPPNDTTQPPYSCIAGFCAYVPGPS